jgi:hypothetical protein
MELRPAVDIADGGMRATWVRAARKGAKVQHGGHLDCHRLAKVGLVDERYGEAPVCKRLNAACQPPIQPPTNHPPTKAVGTKADC